MNKLLNPNDFSAPYILGLDIGGTKTALVLGTLKAEVVARDEILTPAKADFDTAMQVICVAIDKFLQQLLFLGFQAPQAISISVGGPLSIEEGILHAPPHLAAWGEAPLKQYLTERFNLPVLVEHDGSAGALAEYYFGAGRGTRNLIFITMGTGLGAGIILNGAIYHGASGSAGEVGHVRLSDDGPTEYGKVGSWEAFASGAGIAKLAHLRNPQAFPASTTTSDVVQRSLDGDPVTLEIIHEVGTWMGKGLAILVDVLNPEMIIIGTLGILLGDLVLGPARVVLEREALPISNRACKIIPAQLGSSLMDIGCLMAAFDAYRNHKLILGDR
ncbi:MAG: ROK family protein [Chloroflexi bacterium]|nr:ROK family protein [Chloroflexota bacterium]